MYYICVGLEVDSDGWDSCQL